MSEWSNSKEQLAVYRSLVDGGLPCWEAWERSDPEAAARVRERVAVIRAERERSAKYATVANALKRTDYNELTRERLGQMEDIAAERRRQEMGGY